MGADLRIDWADVCRNPDDFERLVKLLLQRLHPDGEVLDGRGGDGGREFQVRTADSLTLYEAKSFTGRVSERNPKRRAQVERSLVSAARHQPDVWHLVVPVDHNPDELVWFDGLRRGDFPFVGRWRGQTWLEEQLARHDDLVRYATGDKLLEYVRKYKIETEALVGGVPDLVKRHQALDELGDTISPYWRPVVGQLPDGSRVITLQAKRSDAAIAEPIRFRFTAAVPIAAETEALRDQLRTSVEFGTSIQLPGQFLSEFTVEGPPALGLPGPGAVLHSVAFEQLPDTDDLPLQTLAVYEPGAAFPLASLDFVAASRTTGRAGARIVAFDYFHSVEMIAEIRRDAIGIHLQSQVIEPATPAAVLPGMRLMRALHRPNILRLTVRNGGRSATQTLEMDGDLSADAPPAEALQYVEDLAQIQDVLRHPFPIPSTFNQDDCDRAARLRRLLAGELVPWLRGPLTVDLSPAKLAEFKAQFSSGGRFLRVSYDNYQVGFGGQVVDIGPLFATGFVTVDLAAIPDHPAAGEEVSATFEVLGDGWLHAQRGVPDDEPPSTGGPLPPGRGRVAYAPSAQLGSSA